MDPYFEIQLEWIRWLQQFVNPVNLAFFKTITFMGEELFYLLFIPFLVWSVDLALGARVGIAFLLSAYLNPVFKELLPEPRPFHLDPSVKLAEAEGYGMPSGHAQTSVVVWGTLAWQVGKKWFWGLAILFMFLIGFSRAFLGVHFPVQVLAGWGVGIVILACYLGLEPRMERWLAQRPLSQQLGLALIIPITLAVVFLSDSTVAAMAVLAGFGSGLALTRRYVEFSTHGVWWQRLVRYALGVVVMMALYFGLSFLFEGVPDSFYYLFRFIRYGLIGLWIGLGAPWMFTKLHLADTAVIRPRYQN